MAGLKVLFASVAGIALVSAAVVGGIVVAPRLVETAGTDGGMPEGARFEGIAPLVFDDPAGDASDVGWGDVGTLANCFAGGVTGGACASIVPTVASPRAAEHVDLVGVAMSEPSADEVLVTLQLARLEEGLDALASPEGMHRMTSYGVCFYTEEDGCTRAAYLNAMRHGDDAHLEARFEAYTEECNEWWWCAWPLPVEIEYGAPAQVHFRIPKEWFAYGSLEVHHVDAWSAWTDQPTAFPMWHGGATVHTPLRHVHDHTFTPGTFGTADMTPELPAGVTLAPPTAAPATAADAPLAGGRAGMTHASGSQYDRSELDLAALDLYDDADGGLAVVFALREATAHPEYDFDHSLSLGFEGKPVLEIGYRQERGEPMGYAGLCIMEECQESRTYEVAAEFIPGAPAFVVVHVPAEILAELADVGPGDTTTLLWASSMVTDGSQYFGDYDGPLYGDVHHAFMADEIIGAMPFTLGAGHRATPESFGAAEEHGH